MEAEDYKTLLRQAEDELGATPGAYCSRKVAVRAMELLRAAGELEFDEADKKWAEVGQQAVNNLKAYVQTIERQAQAIRRLEEEKTRGGLGQVRNPPMGDGIMAAAKASSASNGFMDRYTDSMRRELNIKLDNDRAWKQF